MAHRHIERASSLSGWRKSTYSSSQNDNCLEVLDNHEHGVPVRDSKDPHGPALILSQDAWASFVAAVQRGEFPA